MGGKNKLPMAQLREIAEGCGYEDPRTYIQSGNLVLASVERAVADAQSTLASAIREVTGLDIPVVARSGAQWVDAIVSNPFPDAAADGRTLHVVFLPETASSAVREFEAGPFAPDEIAVRGSEVYLHMPNGMSRSKLAEAVMRLDNANSGTARNWNTVLAIAALLPPRA